MAFQPGRTGYLSIDGTDISGYCDSKSLDRARDTLDVTAFGDADYAYIAGLKSASIPMSGAWDPTLDGVIHGADDGATVAFVFGPEGNDSGDVQYSGNCFFENYSISNSVSGRTEWSATFKTTGAITRGTV